MCFHGLKPHLNVDQNLIFKQKNASRMIKTGRHGLGGGLQTLPRRQTQMCSDPVVFFFKAARAVTGRAEGAHMTGADVHETLLIYHVNWMTSTNKCSVSSLELTQMTLQPTLNTHI